ncbi:MAG TPA: hypothetical protein VGN12_16485 [Pirellulales bacterium]|jgi:hypothetical protein
MARIRLEDLPDPVDAPTLARLLGIEVDQLLMAGQNERLRGRDEFPRPRLSLILGKLAWSRAEIQTYFRRNPEALEKAMNTIIVALNSGPRTARHSPARPPVAH